MTEIHLAIETWRFDSGRSLGPPGGFGEVFYGEGPDGKAVAVKRLHLRAQQAGHRELRVARELVGREFEHVVPIMDAGIDADSGRYFLVMALAGESLQEALDERGPFREQEAVRILRQVVKGLTELDDLVHRDMKPANVLLHDGKWKISDLGIARFVEESTSLATLKDCLSPPYAAPEQWEMDTATHATDVYALGCMAHTLLTGAPPFKGPAPSDYRHQHLNEAAPTLSASPQFRTLVAGMLRKLPEARPRLGRVVEGLARSLNETDSGRTATPLLSVGAKEAERLAEAETQSRKVVESRQRRQDLYNQARESFWRLAAALQELIERSVPDARVVESEGKIVARIGPSWIEIRLVTPKTDVIAGDQFQATDWDVVALATVAVGRGSDVWRSASLWYARVKSDEYRWYEVSYKALLSGERRSVKGHWAVTDYDDADLAASSTTHTYAVAEGPMPVDDEHQDQFCERWAERLAEAYEG